MQKSNQSPQDECEAMNVSQGSLLQKTMLFRQRFCPEMSHQKIMDEEGQKLFF